MSVLKNIPGVIHVANMPGSILDGIGSQSGYSWRGLESDRDVIFKAPRIGYGVIETLDMEIVEGRSFSRNYKDDDYSKIILNESAVHSHCGFMFRVIWTGGLQRRKKNQGNWHTKNTGRHCFWDCPDALW